MREMMTREEKSLLLYFESRAVDHTGRVDTRRMNKTDWDIAKRWNREGFVSFGRIVHKDVVLESSHWCHLHEEAISIAAQLRKESAEKGWASRRYETTVD